MSLQPAVIRLRDLDSRDEHGEVREFSGTVADVAEYLGGRPAPASLTHEHFRLFYRLYIAEAIGDLRGGRFDQAKETVGRLGVALSPVREGARS